MKTTSIHSLTGRAGLVLLTCSAVLSACTDKSTDAVQPTDGAGSANRGSRVAAVSKPFEVKPFSKLKISAEGDIELTQSTTESASLQADDDYLLSLIAVENHGDTLIVRPTGAGSPPYRYGIFKLSINLKSVDYIEYQGQGQGSVTTVNKLVLPTFQLNWNAINTQKGRFSIDAPQMDAVVSGGVNNNYSNGVTRVTFLNSKIKRINLRRFGFGTFDAFYGVGNDRPNLDAEVVHVRNEQAGYGFGTVYIKASKKFFLTNIGPGSIYYVGGGEVKESVNKGGTIRGF